jgi:uncharacterized protein YjbI with pentapeptide repeats
MMRNGTVQITEKFEIRNRWSGDVQFTAEITCSPDALPSVKLGLAVRWARKNGAVLRGADLSDADLSGAVLRGADLSDADLSGAVLRGADLSDADLSDADLSGAVLSGAVLRGADLSGAVLSGADLRGADLRGADLSDADLRGADLSDADLRHVKADFFMILALGHREVPALIAALRYGRVDGSTYSGECACLVGTLENAGAVNLPHQAFSPAESWFVPIRKGTKPGDHSEGGFRSAKALEWALEYAARTGLDIEADPSVAAA